MQAVEITAKCTSCRKVFVMTPAAMDEAKALGCAFSPCCYAPATVEHIATKLARASHPKGVVR
jgi:hypothetical protein